MRTKRLYWLAVLIGLSGCAVDKSIETLDGAVASCDDGARGQECEGSSSVPDEDAASDEEPARRDSGTRNDDDDDDDTGNKADAAQDDEDDMDPVVEEDLDEPTEESVDAGPDASGPEPDAGEDAEVVVPRNCRDDYACGAYGTCDEALAVPACVCVRGYVDHGGGCEWGGGTVDAQLDDASAWGGQNMTFAGGVAHFGHQGSGASCELGILTQQLHMPARAASQAFVLEMDVLSACPSGDPEACPALQVELGGSVTRLVVAGGAGAPSSPVARTVSTCLGDAGYGDDVALRVRPALAYQHGELPLLCESAAWPAIDRIAIRPAAEGECAAPDALLGDVHANAGWALASASAGADGLEIMSGGHAETVVSFATQPAMQSLWFAATGARFIDVTLDGLAWARFDTRLPSLTMCMPAWARGGSHRLTITPVDAAATITQLELRSSAECGDNRFDEGFDRMTLGSSWTSTAGVVHHDNLGYTGQGTLLRSSVSLLASHRFPARSNVLRMALQARYRRQGMQTSTIDYALDPTAGEVISNNNWQSRTVCFPNAWEHQLATLRLDVTLIPTPPTTMPLVWLDDLGIFTVDPASCE